MKIIGLTGGIGSGKSTVAGFFKELGVPVYIADEEAKRLMDSSPEVHKELEKLFGHKVFKNCIPDRKFIASRVFNDPEKLHALNAIIHPRVKAHFLEWTRTQQADYAIYEAAILFETGSYKNCDKTILVTAPYEERITRLLKRDHSTIEEIAARMKNQWTDERKSFLADFVINNVDLAVTWEEVRKIHAFLS
ncbi:MAG TPA: dephospho-CoA kinase [Salinimicrobium sp.]|nr:dephospho-CoA kinase [Salinimicrobium sp.]